MIEEFPEPEVGTTGGGERTIGSPDGSTLYAASEDRGVVVAVNTATEHAGPPIATGYEPVAMTVSPDGRTLYVADRHPARAHRARPINR